MAVAALMGLKHGATSTLTHEAQSPAATAAAYASDPSMPWGQPGQLQQQQHHHQSQQPMDSQQYALAAAMLRSVLETAAHNASGQASTPAQQQAELPITQLSMPGGPSMADVWEQLANQAQPVAGAGAPAAAATAAASPGAGAQGQLGYGASAGVTAGALQAVGQELQQPMQHMEHEGLLVSHSNPYMSAEYHGSAGSGSPAGLAAAGSGSFYRQDSDKSSGGSYSLPRNNSDAGSVDGWATGGLARGMSRFGTEHKQVGCSGKYSDCNS